MTLKTYTETKGYEKFDWNKFLNQEKYTLQEFKDARSRCERWVACAVGNLCDIIPRHDGTKMDFDFKPEGMPKDEKLNLLGCRFAKEVREFNFEMAKKVLIEIELRASELIEEIKKS